MEVEIGGRQNLASSKNKDKAELARAKNEDEPGLERLEQKVKRLLKLGTEMQSFPKLTTWRFIDGREICQKSSMLRWLRGWKRAGRGLANNSKTPPAPAGTRDEEVLWGKVFPSRKFPLRDLFYSFLWGQFLLRN